MQTTCLFRMKSSGNAGLTAVPLETAAFVRMRSGHSGFSLAELVIALLVTGFLGTAGLSLVHTAQRALIPARFDWKGERLAIAPALAVLPEALAVHEALGNAANQARAVYVLGGLHPTLPPQARAAQQQPLMLGKLPTIENFHAGLPLDARHFHEAYKAQLGPANETAHQDDFSVIMVGSVRGSLGITLFAQVRRHAIPPGDGVGIGGVDRVREVCVWTATGDTLRYAFAERADRAGTLFNGAIHSWYRYHEGSSQFEEGPVSAAFPDPWAAAVQSDREGAPMPFSRFIHFWPISR